MRMNAMDTGQRVWRVVLKQKKNILSIGVLLSIALIGYGGVRYVRSVHSYPRYVVIMGTQYTLEIADTVTKQERGLSDRDSLCQTCAMLFVFPDAAPRGFWMRGMRFPLDILWVRGDRIVHIERNIAPDNPAIFRPRASADRVIELNANAASALQRGDRIMYAAGFE